MYFDPATRAQSPQPPLRSAQSMYQSPTVFPPHQPLRRVATSPPVYQPPSVYGPDPNLVYGSPQPPVSYYPHPHNASMYYPPPVPQTQMIMHQPQTIPSFQNFDPNFEAYFGPDVRPSMRSPIDEQRIQLENYSRNRPVRPTNQFTSRSGTLAGQASSAAEERALEEAIELSLTESARQGSISQRYDSGHTTRTNSTRSNDAWDGESTVPGSNMSAEELADEKALQEAIFASIREAELEQERDSKLPDDYDEELCLNKALRDSTNIKDSTKNAKYYQKAPVVPALAVPIDSQYPYNLDRANFSRSLPPPPSDRYAREYENRDNYPSNQRSTSAHRRRTQQPPMPGYAADYYPEQNGRRVTPREDAYYSPRISPQKEYVDVDPPRPPYESPRREYSDREPHRGAAEGVLVQQALQSAQRYLVKEESINGPEDRAKLIRRNSPSRMPREESFRRPSTGRDYVEKDDFYRHELSSPRELYEDTERYPTVRRSAPEARRFDDHAIAGRDYPERDYYPSKPYPEARSTPQYVPQPRSTSATRLRTAPPAVWEDADIPRGYQQANGLRRASNDYYYPSGSGDTGLARARYDAYEKNIPLRSGPSRQSSRGSAYYDSPRTGSEGSSAEDETFQRMQPAARVPPSGYDRPPPTYYQATRRVSSSPPTYLRSGGARYL